MKIAIIGAGLAGLSAAFDLAQAGHDVKVYEATEQAGGLASGFKAEGWDWSLEKYYHHWFTSDDDLLGLAEELGVRDKVFFPRPETVAYYDGKFYALDSPLALLKFPGFGLIDKARFGFTYLYLKLLVKDGTHLEKDTAMGWMQRTMGPRVTDVLWRPMLEGKFGKYADKVNMAWLWARIITRTPKLGTYQGGFQAFCDELAAQVIGRGAVIEYNNPVTHVSSEDGKVTVKTDTTVEEFDRLISTTSPRLMAKIAPDLPESYTGKLEGLTSMAASVLILAIKEKLTDSYWFNLPKEAGYPFLAMVEHTNFLPAEHYGGDTLLYCGDYIDHDHEYMTLTKEEMIERFVPSIQRFNPDFDESWIRDSWIFRTNYGQPVPFVGHSKNIPALKTPLDGVWLASMSQVYPYDRGTNFAVEIGRRVAKLATE